MESGMLEVSVISRSLHSQESHLSCSTYKEVYSTCKKWYNIIIFNFDRVISYETEKIMNRLLELRLAGLRWSGLMLARLFVSLDYP